LPTKRIYYVCGVSWTGKTSIIDLLSEEENCTTIPEFFDPYPDYFPSLTVNSNEALKRASVEWVLNQYKKKENVIRSTQGLIVCDRSPLDLEAYALAFGNNLFQYTTMRMKKVSWSAGALILLLAPNLNELLKRMQDRGGLDSFSSMRLVNELIKPLEKEYIRIFNFTNAKSVPTNCSLEESLKKIESILEEPYCPCNINKVINSFTQVFGLVFRERR